MCFDLDRPCLFYVISSPTLFSSLLLLLTLRLCLSLPFYLPPCSSAKPNAVVLLMQPPVLCMSMSLTVKGSLWEGERGMCKCWERGEGGDGGRVGERDGAERKLGELCTC